MQSPLKRSTLRGEEKAHLDNKLIRSRDTQSKSYVSIKCVVTEEFWPGDIVDGEKTSPNIVRLRLKPHTSITAGYTKKMSEIVFPVIEPPHYVSANFGYGNLIGKVVELRYMFPNILTGEICLSSVTTYGTRDSDPKNKDTNKGNIPDLGPVLLG